MPEYQVKITGTAREHSFGGSKSYGVNELRNFSSKDDFEAYERARELRKDLETDLLSAQLKIDSVVEIRRLNLSTYAL